jgi:hypothetical protein
LRIQVPGFGHKIVDFFRALCRLLEVIAAPQELHQDLEKNKIDSGSELLSLKNNNMLFKLSNRLAKMIPKLTNSKRSKVLIFTL